MIPGSHSLSATTKNSIDLFVSLMKSEGIKKNSQFTHVEANPVLMAFSGLHREDKKRVFDEFKDRLSN